FPNLLEAGGHLAIEALALDGQGQATSLTVEERQPQPLFQRPNTLGNGRLGGALLVGGRRHGAQARRGFKRDERGHGRGTLTHLDKLLLMNKFILAITASSSSVRSGGAGA